MSKFYFVLWLKWSIRLTLCSLGGAFFLAFLITAYIYIDNGLQDFDKELVHALFLVFKFWFVLLWSVTLLFSLYRSLKYLFNHCYGGYVLRLQVCTKATSDYIENVMYSDLFRVWRKWLMLIIWIVGVEMIIAVVMSRIITVESAVFDWFNIYVLYIFILIAGYFSFLLLGSRCKLVKVKKCL